MSEVIGLKEFIRKLDAVASAHDRLPSEVATIAVNFSKERFRDQAWLDTSRQPWKPLARKRAGKKRSQHVLVDKGYLKRSIRKIVANSNTIIIGTDAPYAEIQNNGGIIRKTVSVKQHRVKSHTRKSYTRTRDGRTERIRPQLVASHTVGSHTRRMNTRIPARPFIGQSEALERRIYMHIYYRYESALKK